MQHIRSKTKHDKLIFVLVSLFLALCLLFATACQPGDEDSSSSSSSDSEETEITLPITNGHFTDLTDTSESGSYPRSPRNWSYAGDSLNSETASTSGTTYGVVNTTDVPARAEVRVAGEVTDLVSGRPVSAENGGFSLEMQPYQLRSFRTPGSAAVRVEVR